MNIKKGKQIAALVSCAFFALGSAFAQGADAASTGSDFGDLFSSAGASAGSDALTIGGSLDLSVRSYLGSAARSAVGNEDNDADAVEAPPEARVNFDYKGASTECVVNFHVDPSTLSAYPEDLIDEAFVRAFLPDFTFEAGKMKVVWGKGDELHVIDLFNANDYTDFIFPEYADRRLGEVMFRGAWNDPNGKIRVEAIWTPVTTPDRLPGSGAWGSSDLETLTTLATALHVTLPDTDTLDYGQYGVRVTGTAGPVDLGLSYYLGHYKTPSAYVGYTGAVPSSLALAYDRLQAFGAEAAFAAGPFNFRFEGAYYLTDDTDGTDASTHNNSLNWVAGFDADLPIHNVNLNLQTIGSYVLNNDGLVLNDVDYDSDGEYSNDKIVVKLSDSFCHDKIAPAVKALWGIEKGDVIVMPEVACNIRDDLSVTVSGALFLGSEDGEFGDYTDNDFARILVSYKF